LLRLNSNHPGRASQPEKKSQLVQFKLMSNPLLDDWLVKCQEHASLIFQGGNEWVAEAVWGSAGQKEKADAEIYLAGKFDFPILILYERLKACIWFHNQIHSFSFIATIIQCQAVKFG